MSHPMPVLFLDGGLGTTLEQPPYSFSFGPQTPLWSSHLLVAQPSTLVDAHSCFVAAGADIILTATYQASLEGFTKTPRVNCFHEKDRESGVYSGYRESEAFNYMRSASLLARESFVIVSKTPRIALSLGPYGATIIPAQEYTGAYPLGMSTQSALKDWHLKRLDVFASDFETWGICEWVAFETIKRPDEVRAVREAMSTVTKKHKCTEKKWWVTGVFPGENIDEDEIKSWVRAALSQSESSEGVYCAQPWGIGVNCTSVTKTGKIIEIMEAECKMLLGETNKAYLPWLVVYPDGAIGLRYDNQKMAWIEELSSNYPGSAPWDELVWRDVKDIRRRQNWKGCIVGGCCKTGPEEIRSLRNRADINL